MLIYPKPLLVIANNDARNYDNTAYVGGNGVTLNGLVALPTKIKRFCVLRSPHIDKDSREHFELRIYKNFIDITTESPSIIDLLLKTEVPAGVSCNLKVLKA